MKSVLSLLFALFVSRALSQSLATCGILNQYDFQLYDVSAATYNYTTELGVMSANLCVDMERSCSYTSNNPCSVCQYVDAGKSTEHSYCTGYNNGEQYTALDQDAYKDKRGFRAIMKGDSIYCPIGADGKNIPRTTNIDVVCDSTYTQMEWYKEDPICTYNSVLYIKGPCQVSDNSFTPTFTIGSLTPNSIEVYIVDAYQFMFWTYSVYFNDMIAYTGTDRRVTIENLDAGNTYNIVVKAQSGPGAPGDFRPKSFTSKVVTLPTNIGNFHNPIVSGTGAGIAYGIIIALCILGALVGGYKFYKSDYFADKFGVGGSKSSKGFSLMDAEKSNAFE